MPIQLRLVLALFLTSTSAVAIDLDPLWDFSRPDVSEQRFRKALEGASGDDALILQTQIARTHGLRKDFDKARSILNEIEPQIATAGDEARARYELELGRTYASATHPRELQSVESKERARTSYQAALHLSRKGRLDALAIDAIHMLAFVDTAPADQLKWAQEALSVVDASSQAAAKQWEASIRNNVGLALHQLGRYEEALAHFKEAVKLRARGTNATARRIADWMVAWTLRALNRSDEAIEMQLRLERENDAAGQPDKHVYEELKTLYGAKGDEVRSQHYAALKKTATK